MKGMKYRAAVLIALFAAFLNCKQQPSGYIRAAGVVDGEIISLKSLVSGKILKLNLNEGMQIKKDEALVEIEADKIAIQMKGLDFKEKEISINSNKLQRRISFLRSNLDYWKSQVERFERLREKNSISGDELEKAKLKLKEIETSLFETEQTLQELKVKKEDLQNERNRLELILKDHTLFSPVTGLVLDRYRNEGEIILPGTSIADILDTSSLFVETFVEERELGRMRIGQKVEIFVDGIEGRTFSGEISLFGREAEFSPKYILSEQERQSLLYKVKISINGDNEVFKVGMPVTIQAKAQTSGN
ncbi:MAG: efflux RND transporter periplasmic adaptor subunit [Candidatus Aminicenantes bacterium]|nr:efflux RND transporter periplasmic adaptor subunit [Candidatus Aminicenantes bacterium]